MEIGVSILMSASFRLFRDRVADRSGKVRKVSARRSPFSKLKVLLSKAAARTVPDLWQALKRAINQFTDDDSRNFFRAAGYEPE